MRDDHDATTLAGILDRRGLYATLALLQEQLVKRIAAQADGKCSRSSFENTLKAREGVESIMRRIL